MNDETSPAPGVPPAAGPTPVHLCNGTEHGLCPLHEFSMHFTSSTRGARLARRLISHRLDSWGHPYPGHVNETLTLVAGELTANAVRHGHVAGRDFHVRLTESGGSPDILRVEVSDTRTERVPSLSAEEPPGDEETGRGLYIVALLTPRWAVVPRAKGPGKTVWAELRLPDAPPVLHPVCRSPADSGHLSDMRAPAVKQPTDVSRSELRRERGENEGKRSGHHA